MATGHFPCITLRWPWMQPKISSSMANQDMTKWPTNSDTLFCKCTHPPTHPPIHTPPPHRGSCCGSGRWPVIRRGRGRGRQWERARGRGPGTGSLSLPAPLLLRGHQRVLAGWTSATPPDQWTGQLPIYIIMYYICIHDVHVHVRTCMQRG